MDIGTYTDGRALTYDESTQAFSVGDAPVTIEQVMGYDIAGQITWASEDMRSWAHSLGTAGANASTPGQQSAVPDAKQPEGLPDTTGEVATDLSPPSAVPSERKSKKPLVVAAVLVVFLALGGVAVAVVLNSTPVKVARYIDRLDDEDTVVANEALDGLVEFGEPAVDPLIEALDDPASQTRSRAVSALAAIGDPRAVDPIANQMLTDSDWVVQREAAAALGQIGDADAVGPLIEAMNDDTSSPLRVAAAKSLGLIGDTSTDTVMSLMGALGFVDAAGDSDAELVAAASDALVLIGEPAGEALVVALGDTEGGVRLAAAYILGEIGYAGGVDALIGALTDRQSDVAETAGNALASIGDPAVQPLLDTLASKDPAVRAAAARMLGDMEEGRAIGALISLLRDVEWTVASAAEGALVNIGKPSVKPLMAIVADGNAGDQRWAAADILLAIGEDDLEVLAPLTTMLDKPDLQGIANNYIFFIKLGRDGSESTMNDALIQYGDKAMGLDYLNCGNDELDQGAVNWAARNGYVVTRGAGSHSGPTWGEGF